MRFWEAKTVVSRTSIQSGLGLLLCLAAGPLHAADKPISLEVALGDVSLNKVSFLIAADAGIYQRNGLDVHQFITPGAAQVARNSGIVVPVENVKADIGNAPISIGGGSPMIYRLANGGNVHRIVLATSEAFIRDHIIASADVKSVADLKGKRLGYSVPGAVTHVGAIGFAKVMGWEPGKDIMLVGGGNALNPLREGREDALLGSGMLFAMASDLKFKDLIDLTQYKIPVAGSSILAEKNWLAANRDRGALCQSCGGSRCADENQKVRIRCGAGEMVQHQGRGDATNHVPGGGGHSAQTVPRGRRHQEHARHL